jgi:hypothetical protein
MKSLINSVKRLAGTAGYIDRLILRTFHMDDHPTCKNIYETQVPYDPEGRELQKKIMEFGFELISFV